MTVPLPPEPLPPLDSGTITQEDVDRAAAAWERASLPQDKPLLDAVPPQPGEPNG